MNDFTLIQNNQASTKILLARIEPARYVNDSLVLSSGTTYTMSFPFDISSVYENETLLTKVSGSPATGQFSYNETTKLLTVNLNAAISSTNPIIVYYYLFFTTDRVRTIGVDPENPTVNLRDWEPRIKGSPSFNQNITNILNGIMSISSSSINIINNESYFEQYCTDNDSFYNKKIELWHVLDEITNIKKMFKGFITEISVNRTTANISFRDNLNRLNLPALMGDTVTYFTNDNFTNVQPLGVGRAIPYFFGRVSRHQLISETVTGLPGAQKLTHDEQYQAFCTNYTTDITTSNNREYHAGRVGSNGTENFGFTPSNIDQTSANYTRIDGTSGEVAKIFIGDTFQMNGSGIYPCRVLYVDRVSNYIYIGKDAGITNGDNVVNNDCPSVTVKRSGVIYYCIHGRDYTASLVTLASGNKLVKIVFENNFESNVGMPTALDPQSDEVRYKIKPKFSDQLHGTVLNEIVTKSGLTVNATSVTNANSALSVNANFSIPFFDESDFSNYTRYIEELLQSTIGYIFLDNDLNVSYKVFQTPSGTTETSDTDILENSFGFDFDYNDIVTQIICFNPHHNSEEFVLKTSVTKTSVKSKALHAVNIATRFRHVLEDYTTRSQDLINIRSERFALYRYKTKQQNYITQIGDDFLLKKNGLPGNVTNRSVKIIGYNKQINETSITATDLYNL